MGEFLRAMFDYFFTWMGFVLFLAVGFIGYGFLKLIEKALINKRTETFRYKIGDWYYSRTWRVQNIIRNTVYTIWYTVLGGGLLFGLVYFGN